MKRFYREATVSAEDGGFAVLLDGRPVKTPKRAPLRLPSAALAERIAAEWRDQPEEFDPAAMALTKCANTALDQVADKMPEVAGAVLAFANDLLCYRAVSPRELVALQSESWDPLLDWVETRFGVRLATGQGVVPFDQPPAAMEALGAYVGGLNPFALTALHGVAALTGSLVLALAVAEGRLAPAGAFALSRLDETYQMSQWGADAEAEAAAAARGEEVEALGRFLRAALS